MNMTDLEQLLLTARDQRASDVIVTVGSPPTFRIDGLIRMKDGRALDGEATKALVYGILSAEQVRQLELHRELDFSITRQSHRFRGNAYWQSGSVAAAFRLIPDVIPRPEDLGIPEIAVDFVQRPQGPILITGASSQGKTTSQASLRLPGAEPDDRVLPRERAGSDPRPGEPVAPRGAGPAAPAAVIGHGSPRIARQPRFRGIFLA